MYKGIVWKLFEVAKLLNNVQYKSKINLTNLIEATSFTTQSIYVGFVHIKEASLVKQSSNV